MRGLGDALTEEEVKSFIAALDKDDDGCIGLTEFTEFLQVRAPRRVVVVVVVIVVCGVLVALDHVSLYIVVSVHKTGTATISIRIPTFSLLA